MKALQGLKVLDLTRLLPGPFATMFLADFGAEVIKIEQPGEGDYSRSYEPQLAGIGYRFLILNRNKKSMTLNLKSAEGKEIFRKMAADADVVIESFRPGVMKKLGLDYESVSSINPRVIFCSVSGFGQQGPYAMEAGHDLNYISLAGIPSLTGERGEKPVIPGIQIADLTAGLMAVIGILTAVQARNHTGRGQYIDVSLFASAMAMLASDASTYFGSAKVPLRGEGRLTGGWPNYYIYETKDGRYLACGALEKKFWINLCKVIEREDMIDQVDNPANYEAIRNELTKVFAERTLSEWENLLENKDTCVTPVKNIDEVFSDPHVLVNGLAVTQFDARLGEYRQLGVPIKLSDTPGQLVKSAPGLGEHTIELLQALGYSDAQIALLRENETI